MAGGIRESGDDELDEQHEINVTPFIDVMLVLLIIFMVAAPLATVDVNVDLPGSTATPQPRPEQPIYVTLRDDLSINVGNDVVAPEALTAALETATDDDREQRLFLRADQAVPYGDLMTLLNDLRASGYLKIALVGLETLPATEPAP
ncbi:outer membrane transport energization protein ExbD [Devosia sp. YR412]|uniref:TonB system transport protein ExbD n=1 Tax=Devosia sp. YR412 TaxID=1881030 RepID=UPI0008D1AEAD|nr:TonB system transport protein ExbD [Devosia sp. YR412]SEQ60225.1 outer membrane transport energization protein ExbD [Devosia sp. YR412]